MRETQPLTADRIRLLWSQTYNTNGKPDWSHLFPHYHEQISFKDSIQQVEGKKDFMALCNRLAKRCKQLDMELYSIVRDGEVAFLQWKMTMIFRIFPKSSIYGCSKLTIDRDELIVQQRDYYDLWGDIYDRVPGLRQLYRGFMHTFFG